MVGIYDDGRVLKIFFGIQSRQTHQIFIVVVRNSLSVLVYTTSENEHAVKLFVRFILAKAVITNGMELMLTLFNIVQDIVSLSSLKNKCFYCLLSAPKKLHL